MKGPKVTLVNWTQYPIETVYAIWQASKTEDPLLSISEVRSTPLLMKEAETLFWQVITQGIPVGEHLSFIFMLENVSVSFREQMVRHRIGCHVGDRLGVDIIPDLADSSWWSQSMRIQNMGEFAHRGNFRIPQTVKDLGGERRYCAMMEIIEGFYNELLEKGVPMEDAREVIPLGAHHRISWALNLQSIIHIIGKRCCWILQAGLWEPIISGMIDEMGKKVHPMFRRLAHPPCISKDGEFSSCVFKLENERRMSGDDDHPPCPLWLCRDVATQFHPPEVQKKSLLEDGWKVHRRDELIKRAETYRKLWGHDPYLWTEE